MDDESKGADVGPPSPNPVQLSMLSWVGSDAPTPAAACTVAAVRCSEGKDAGEGADAALAIVQKLHGGRLCCSDRSRKLRSRHSRICSISAGRSSGVLASMASTRTASSWFCQHSGRCVFGNGTASREEDGAGDEGGHTQIGEQ